MACSARERTDAGCARDAALRSLATAGLDLVLRHGVARGRTSLRLGTSAVRQPHPRLQLCHPSGPRDLAYCDQNLNQCVQLVLDLAFRLRLKPPDAKGDVRRFEKSAPTTPCTRHVARPACPPQ